MSVVRRHQPELSGDPRRTFVSWIKAEHLPDKTSTISRYQTLIRALGGDVEKAETLRKKAVAERRQRMAFQDSSEPAMHEVTADDGESPTPPEDARSASAPAPAQPANTRRHRLRAVVAVALISGLIVGAAIAATIVSARSTAGPDHEASVSVKPMAQIQSLFSSTCLDVRGPSSAVGTPVQIWDCINVPEEYWTYDNRYHLVGYAGNCLDTISEHPTVGQQVVMAPCDDAHPTQTWRFEEDGSFRSVGDLCLDVRGPLADNGTPVQLWTCVGAPQQQWRFLPK